MRRISHIAMIALALLASTLTTPVSHAATTYSCGSGDREFHTWTGDSLCRILTIVVPAPATGTIRVVSSNWTGSIRIGVQNASSGAKCIGEGQESYYWGCDVGGSFLMGMPNNGLPASEGYGTRRVSLTAGTFRMGGSASPTASQYALGGTWRVELVLD